MSDVCAITGKDKVINYKNLVGISTRGSKLIPTLQDRYHETILAKTQIAFLDRAKENAEKTGQPFEESTENDKAVMFSKLMTKRPSRSDIITLIKFQNEDIMKLIEELRSTLE